MIRFSEWQTDRLRDCLRAYHQYEHDTDGRYYTWQDVREAIAEYTGVEIGGTGRTGPKKGAERLRQFVEGINDKANPGQKKYPVPKQATLKAIYKFVTHKHIGLLSKEELEEFKPELQAPLRLIEYLGDGSNGQRRAPVEKLTGAFTTIATTDERQVRRIFQFSRPLDWGLMQVREWEIYFGQDNPHELRDGPTDAMPVIRPSTAPDSEVRHTGWAILTPEDNLFIFLKNERNGRNRYYFTLGIDLVPWNEDPVARLAFLLHDFPVEMVEPKWEHEYKALIMREMDERTLVCWRVSQEIKMTQQPEVSQ